MTRTRHIALLALVLGGCSLIIDPTAPRVTNHCAANIDCMGGAHCDATMSMCIQPPSLPYDLWLEVAPPTEPNGTTPSPFDLGPFTSFMGPVPLVVPRQVTVSGSVHRMGTDATDVPVAAQITFTPVVTGHAPLGVRSVSTRTTGTDGAYTTSLPSGVDYDVLVEPLGELRATIPPFRSHLVAPTSDSALPIPLPADETHIEGVLVADGNGVSGFELVALDRATGAQLSSVATSGAAATAPGHFSLAMRPTTAAFDLVIRPSSALAMLGPVPTYRVRPEGLLPDPMGHVRILVPSSRPAVHWAGTVEYPESRGSVGVGGAVVQLHSDDVTDVVTGVVGSIDLTLTTDTALETLGRYDGLVLPGNYTVTITAASAADDVLGVLRETRDLHPSTGSPEILGHVFHLPLRSAVSGSVQSPDGDLLRDANVRATPLGIPLATLTDPDVARLARPATARSGPMGDFRLDLDVGVYDIVAEPPDGSGFPWTVVLENGIGGSTATLPFGVMQVDAPVVVDSDVRWMDGGMLSGAEVRAFAITPDGRAVMVARSTSDAHGHARMLVPAVLGTHNPAMTFAHH